VFKSIAQFFRRRQAESVQHEASPANVLRRALTEDEEQLLRLIQQSWGPHNTLDNLFFMDEPGTEGAWIFARDSNGTMQRGINLTNVSAWFRDGTYSSKDVADAIGKPS
jgi:hypothetical protein